METRTKTEPTKGISEIKKGSKDQSDNTITNVLSKKNEFVIYEIDSKDPEDRLRILIDGHTDESENEIVKKFNKVKMKYVTAKGLLYKSSNFNLMKNRVAHALSTVLTDDLDDPNEIFDTLIKEIQDDYSSIIKKRGRFLLFPYAALLFMGILCSFLFYINIKPENNIIINLLYLLFGSIAGGALSMTFTVKHIKFDPNLETKYYILLSVERLALSVIAGLIAFIGVKAGLILNSIDTGNIYMFLFIMVLSGFSERFIPNILKESIK